MDTLTDILVVEDSLTQAMKLRYLLERAGYAVTVAVNGVEGLAAAKLHKPALVISDVVMPEMDGYEFCRVVKADEDLKDVFVVLLTTLSTPGDVVTAIQAGADNYIVKPYDDDYLLSRVRYILATLELRRGRNVDLGIQVHFGGRQYYLDSSRIQIIDFLLSTIEVSIQKHDELWHSNRELRDALVRIKILEANYRRLLETNTDGVVVLSEDRIVRYANAAAHMLFGFTPDTMAGSRLDALSGCCSESSSVAEIVLARDGEQRVVEVRTIEMDWEGEDVVLAALRDVTEQACIREELRDQSLRDELTGLYNRRAFHVLGEHELRVAERGSGRLFLAFIDVDGLKPINDRLGHTQGDMALVDTAGLLTTTYRAADVIARLGGDEFAVLGVVDDTDGAETLRRRLMDAVDVFNRDVPRPFELGLSTGVVTFEAGPACSISSMLQQADSAMYESKLAKRRAAPDDRGEVVETSSDEQTAAWRPSQTGSQS